MFLNTAIINQPEKLTEKPKKKVSLHSIIDKTIKMELTMNPQNVRRVETRAMSR